MWRVKSPGGGPRNGGSSVYFLGALALRRSLAFHWSCFQRCLEGSSLSDDNERCPVVGMRFSRTHALGRTLHCLAATNLPLKIVIVLSHQIGSLAIVYLPQASDNRLCSRHLESTPESVDTLSIEHCAHARITGRQHHQFSPKEVQFENLLRRQDSVAISAWCLGRFRCSSQQQG